MRSPNAAWDTEPIGARARRRRRESAREPHAELVLAADQP
jgi:hypothetical protein